MSGSKSFTIGMPEEQKGLVRATVSATLRTMAEWGLEFSANRKPARDELFEIAQQVDDFRADEMCCPVCEEVTCDEICPLAPVRSQEGAAA